MCCSREEVSKVEVGKWRKANDSALVQERGRAAGLGTAAGSAWKEAQRASREDPQGPPPPDPAASPQVHPRRAFVRLAL